VSFVSKYLERLRFRFGPRVAEWLIDLSTSRAKLNLTSSEPIGILVDNTVLADATTHETAWISTGPTQWGNQFIDTGYSARISVHPAETEQRAFHHVQYLPGLISLYRHGHIHLHSSAELKAEQFRKPSGMFRGYGYFDHNLFNGVSLESLDGYAFPNLGPSWMKLPSAEDQQREKLAERALADPEYASLVDVLGQKNSQDAWHIRTAELHGLYCFLTMDFSLIETLNAQSGAKRIKALKTRIMTPADFGKHVGLVAISPRFFSYHDASFPVRGDIAWPDGKRRGRGKNKLN
jgi:hypothetical protein